MKTVQIPYKPRPFQKAVARQMAGHRFGVLVCHRRFGKTVVAVNVLQQGALMCTKPRPRFAYIGPTYRQAKQNAWDYIQYFARPIPGIAFNQSELRADYLNEGQVRVYGADNPDSLRGIYLDGVVLDEYGLMSPSLWGEVIRPALSDRQGWALFIGTPNGKNQFYDIKQYALRTVGPDKELQREDGWFFAEYKASQTDVLTPQELASARATMTQDEYDQEYECSFEAAVKGAIFGKELETARSGGGVTVGPDHPQLPVETTWDLGVGDAMAIWFSQSLRGGEVRLIDYYEASGEGFPHYMSVLNGKGYIYGDHWAPHDIEVREMGSGRSRLEVAAGYGLRVKAVARIHSQGGEEGGEGIHAARMLFQLCWFDAEKCRAGLESLQHYRRDYNQRIQEFKATPVHDWASHGADAFRYLAVRQRAPKDKPPARREAYAGSSSWAG